MKLIKEVYEESVNLIKAISPAPESDVKRMMAHFCNVSSLDLIINQEKSVSPEMMDLYNEAIEKRLKGLPVQYICNEQEFMGLSFYVDERVLIPRGETELLVERVLDLLEDRTQAQLMDIGVGSGAICLSLAKLADTKQIYGIDISEDALTVARKNRKTFGLDDKVTFFNSNVFENVPENLKGTIDILISNPPYIPPEEMEILHDDVKKEPALALYGGLDGLDFYRQITSEGWFFLKDDGILVYEVGHDQGERVKSLMLGTGFKRVEFIEDYQGFKRVVIGYKL